MLAHKAYHSETTKERVDIDNFMRKLKEYVTLLWDTETKTNIATTLNDLFVLTTDEYVIQEAFQKLINEKLNTFNAITLTTIFHVTCTAKIDAHHILRTRLKEKSTVYIVYLSEAADKYLDIFYQGFTPSELIHTIHDVWKSIPEIEFIIQMTYLGSLLEKKEYKEFKSLVSSNIEFFATHLEENMNTLKFARTTSFIDTSILYLLYCLIFANPKSGLSISTVVFNIQCFRLILNQGFCEGFYQFVTLLHEDQLPCASHIILQLIHPKDLNYSLIICAIINASVKLMENKYYDKSKNFLRQNLKYLQDVTCDIIDNINYKIKRGYCLILLKVLHDCSSCEDANGTELAATALRNLKVSISGNRYNGQFHRNCYMGCAERGLESDIKDRLVTFPKRTETFSHSKDYSYLYRENREVFVTKLKQLNGQLNKCTNKTGHLKHERYYNKEKDDDDLYSNNYLNVQIDHSRDTLFKILEHVADDCREENELKDLVKTLCRIELNPEVEELYIEAISNSVYIKLKNEQTKIAQFVLKINKDVQECSFLDNLTSKVAEYLSLDEQVIKDKRKVVYKCFCKVRHALNKTDKKDMEDYKEHFTFIRYMEKEEEMKKVFKYLEFLIIVMLLLIGSTYGGHHKSAEMKKYLSLKYEYDKAILYLLWCSGDVEINPGPTLQKLKSTPASQMRREWVCDKCSKLLKRLKGFPDNSKPKDLWKDKPDNWPCDQPFYDPWNKSKEHNEDVKSNDSLLKCILDLCNEQKLDISQDQREITAWRDDNKTLLFEIHTCRKEIQKINTAIQCLINYKDTCELQQMLEHIKILIDFSVLNFNNKRPKGSTYIIRGVAVLLCKISKGIHPMEKIDGIWTTEPIGWKKGSKFYDPNNAGKRTDKNQDKKLVNALVKYIETRNINIPPEYTALVTSWKQHNMPELCKIYTVHINVAVIENALKHLQLEGLLDKSDIHDKLKLHGVTLSTGWFNGCGANSEICDSSQASTGHQGTYVNQSNAQKNSGGRNDSKCGSIDNSSSCRKRSNKTCSVQKGNCHNKKRKLSHNYDTATNIKRKQILSANATLDEVISAYMVEKDKANDSNYSSSPTSNDKTGQSSYLSANNNVMKLLSQHDEQSSLLEPTGLADMQVFKEHFNSTESTGEQDIDILADNNPKTAVQQVKPSVAIDAQDHQKLSDTRVEHPNNMLIWLYQPISASLEKQTDNAVDQINKIIAVSSVEQTNDTVDQENQRTAFLLSEQSYCIQEDSTENHVCKEDRLPDDTLECYFNELFTCDHLDDKLVKDMGL